MKATHPASAAALVAALLAAPSAPGATVRFPGAQLAGGGAVAPHASASGEPSDAAAARRRAEIVRSPYLQIAEETGLRGGEVRVGFEGGVSEEIRGEVISGLSAFLTAFWDCDGWSRVGSFRAPLVLYVTGQRDAHPAAGWSGRDGALLVRPVAVVPAGGRKAEAIVLDLAHQTALLSLRQSAPDAAAWAVEGMAEYLSRRALGLDGEPVPVDDRLLAESGSMDDPAAFAELLPSLVEHLSLGVSELRSAWEEAGSRRGDESESLLRTLGTRADPRGIAGILGDLLVRRLSRLGSDDPVPGGRHQLPAGGFGVPAPPPLGWRMVAMRTTEEAGGVELVLPDPPRCGAGRALIAYRGEGDGFDAADLEPGESRRIPVSGTTRLTLVLVDGGDPGDLFVEMRRLPGYPATLSGFSAEWIGDAVRLSWRTERHRDLLAWVVSRVDETEGEPRQPARRLVPTSESDEEPFAYQVDDTDVVAGHLYRYRVHALTTGGTLSEAFEAPVVAGR